MAARARVVVLAALLVSGCAMASPPFLPEPAPGTLFRSPHVPPGPGPFPAVILLHTCGGIEPHLFQWADRLNERGYAAVVLNSFAPRGADKCVVPRYFPASGDEVAGDAFAALAHLRTRPGIDGARIGVMGFSWGANAALRVASRSYHRDVNRFGAVVSLYPMCVSPPDWSGASRERASNLHGDVDTPTLILIGENDRDTPRVVENCVAAVAALRRAGRPVEITLHPGADHAFDKASRYHAEATRDAASTALRFLDQHLRAGRRSP